MKLKLLKNKYFRCAWDGLQTTLTCSANGCNAV